MRNRIRNILQSQIMGGCDMSGCALTGGRRKRAPSAYNKFVSAKLKKGHTMKEAIKLWRQSSGYKAKKRGTKRKIRSRKRGGASVRDKNACVSALLDKNPLLTEAQAKRLLKEYYLYDDLTGECDSEFPLPTKYTRMVKNKERKLQDELDNITLTPAQLKKKRSLDSLARRLKLSSADSTLKDDLDLALLKVQLDPMARSMALLEADQTLKEAFSTSMRKRSERKSKK